MNSLAPPAEFQITQLLATPTVRIRDVRCEGSRRHMGAEERAVRTYLVYPYRGIYVRHVGVDDSVAEPNQVLYFNAGESYRVSHPIAGGDSSFVVEPEESILRELAPKERLLDGEPLRFRIQRSRLDTRAQALAALLRHSLKTGVIEQLEAESLALTLIRRTLGPNTSREPTGSSGHRKLVDRTKLVLSGDLSRRWALSDIAAEVGVSPVYLTQVFQRVEGVPLYRYQLRLRLAQALDLIGKEKDLTSIALDLGFSNHSHFTSAFRQAYGRSPSAFKDIVLSKQGR
ncbi:MAG: helix-turn-helix transcriptional regulator [Proteobacteria bacterium]|nr:helix-turn-helix transcriptional regulator [Pseudomonadota bacterium]